MDWLRKLASDLHIKGVHTGCIEMMRPRKVRILSLIESPIFTNTPCKSTCLCNAPSLHIVDEIHDEENHSLDSL